MLSSGPELLYCFVSQIGSRVQTEHPIVFVQIPDPGTSVNTFIQVSIQYQLLSILTQ